MSLTYSALSKYQFMWLYVMFDLPTNTAKQRRNAGCFRKELLKDGYSMMQYSVYIRHCASYASADMHIQRLKAIIPEEGMVSVLKVTDKQFCDTVNFCGQRRKPPPTTPRQLELF